MDRVKLPRTIRREPQHYQDGDSVFHLTINAHPTLTQWPEGVGEMIWNSLMEQRARGDVELLAACLMPDHLHVLLKPGRTGVSRWLNVWKSWTTRLAWGTGFHGALWQPGMWDRTVRNANDFAAVIEYIIRNPIVAGFVSSQRDWAWTWVWYWDEAGGTTVG
jgi:REP element-mobilizing transposase RayT